MSSDTARLPSVPVDDPRGPHGDLLGVARGGALNLAGAIANALLQFGLVVVMTHSLGAHGTGIFFEAVALFMIVCNVGQFGSDSGLVRMIPPAIVNGRHEQIRAIVKTSLWPVVLAGAAVGLATVVFAPQLGSLFMKGVPRAEASRYISVLAPFIPMTTATLILLAVTRGFGTMGPTVAVENVGKPAMRLVLVAIVVLAGGGVMGAALAWAVPVAIGLLLTGVYVTRQVHALGGVVTVRERRADRAIARRFWRFSLPRGFAGVLEILLGWVDLLLVGAFRSPTEVGIYAAVSRTAVMALFAIRASSMAIAPRLSALLSLRRRSDAEHLYQVATWWLMALSWPVYLVLAIFAPFLLEIFGSRFVTGQTALMTLSLAMLVNMATGNVNAVLLMAGRSTWNLVNAFVALALNIGMNIFLIPRYGLEGAAISWAAAIVVQNAMAILEVRFLLELDPFGSGYYLVAVASGVCFGLFGLLIRMTIGANALGFSVFAVVSVIVYGFVLYRGRNWLRLGILRDAVRLSRRSRSSLDAAESVQPASVLES
jgi:O-antigen/teichoic acid export membrane protein